MRLGKSAMVAAVAILLSQGYVFADHENRLARISYVDGGFYLQRAENYDTGEVGVNTPVGTGDSLWTERGARLEIEFDGLNFLRLDENSRVKFDQLGQGTRIALEGGSIYLDISNSGQLEIGTQFAGVRVLQSGLYRIDLGYSGGLLVSVYEGMAEVTNGAGSITVRSGQQTQVASGRLPGYPGSMSLARRDSFDDFQNARAGSVSYDNNQTEYLPQEVASYGYELNQYGRWQYFSPYGYVWCPAGVVADWRPYRDGYWDYVPRCGWTWISYEPWGWAPYHYGRWDFSLGVGWFWIPGRVWGPAWVSWTTYGGYLGWCPLNYYDRPVVIVNNYYGGWWGDNWVSNPDSRSWTFIPKESIGNRDIARVAIGENQVRGISRITVSKDPAIGAPVKRISGGAIKGGSVIGIGRGDIKGGNGIHVGGSGAGGPVTAGSGPIIRNDPVGGSSGGTIRGGSGVVKGGESHDGRGSNGIVYVPPKSGVSTTGGSVHSGPVVIDRGNGSSSSGGNQVHVTPRDGASDRNDRVIYVSPKGGSGDNSSGGNQMHVTPRGSSSDGNDRIIYVSPKGGSSSGNRIEHGSSDESYSGRVYQGRSDVDRNTVTIERDPEERGFEDDDEAVYSRGSSGSSSSSSGSFWGKVYDQFRSNSHSSSSGSTVERSGSSGGSSQTTTRSGSSGSSQQSRGGSSVRSAPSPRPAPAPPKSSGGNKIKKD